MRSDKGLTKIGDEPLICHTLKKVSEVVDEVLVVLGSEDQRKIYTKVLSDKAIILVDSYKEGSPLVGALTGLQNAKGEYTLITACDMPFISPKAVKMLFNAAKRRDGAVFQWPNGWIEPLLAVYKVKPSLEEAHRLYREGNLRLRMILRRLPDVNLIPIKELKTIDPELITLFDADTKESLTEAEEILKKRKSIT